MLSCRAWTAAPSGVKSLISRRLAGIVARGIHSPAKNISGKNSMVPITPAERPVGASAAISIPRPSIAVAASTYVTPKPAGCPGSATPKPSRPTARIPAVATRATARLMASWAAMIRTGPTGVVARRRRIRRSR